MEGADKVNGVDGHIPRRAATTRAPGAGHAARININSKIVPTRHR